MSVKFFSNSDSSYYTKLLLLPNKQTNFEKLVMETQKVLNTVHCHLIAKIFAEALIYMKKNV